MTKRYTAEEREQALKLAAEIGAAAAARRLGINENTLYGWRGRKQKRTETIETAIDGQSEAKLQEKIRQLQAQLRQSQQDVEILQEALRFFAKCRTP